VAAESANLHGDLCENPLRLGYFSHFTDRF